MRKFLKCDNKLLGYTQHISARSIKLFKQLLKLFMIEFFPQQQEQFRSEFTGPNN